MTMNELKQFKPGTVINVTHYTGGIYQLSNTYNLLIVGSSDCNLFKLKSKNGHKTYENSVWVFNLDTGKFGVIDATKINNMTFNGVYEFTTVHSFDQEPDNDYATYTFTT